VLDQRDAVHGLLDSDSFCTEPSITLKSGGRRPSRSSLPCCPSVRRGSNLLSRVSPHTMSPRVPSTPKRKNSTSFSTLFTACKVRSGTYLSSIHSWLSSCTISKNTLALKVHVPASNSDRRKEPASPKFRNNLHFQFPYDGQEVLPGGYVSCLFVHAR
jgi:hypothetical protein